MGALGDFIGFWIKAIGLAFILIVGYLMFYSCQSGSDTVKESPAPVTESTTAVVDVPAPK